MTDEPFALAPRRKSRPVHVGDVKVGGDAPVIVQTMTNTDTADAEATIEQIARLANAGAEIVRVAVPDRRAADALPDIISRTPVPLIADIHFDHRLALAPGELRPWPLRSRTRAKPRSRSSTRLNAGLNLIVNVS